MSIMDFFRGTQGTAAQETTASTQQATTATNEQTQDLSTMDSFKDLWNNAPIEGETATEDPADLTSLFTIDPKKIGESVSTIDFTESLPPDLLEKVSAGGDEAVKALLSSFNSFGRDVFSKAMLANGMLVKQAFSKAQGKIDARTSNNFRSLKVSEELTSTNPLLKDPSVVPIVSAIRKQLESKYPDASAADIQAQTEKYLVNFAKLVQGPEKSKSTERDTTDFSNFFD